jgi:hypothetical protein
VISPGGAAICCALLPLGSEPEPLLPRREPPAHGRSKKSHPRALLVRLLPTVAPLLRTTQLWSRNCGRSWQRSPPPARSQPNVRSAVARLSSTVKIVDVLGGHQRTVVVAMVAVRMMEVAADAVV